MNLFLGRDGLRFKVLHPISAKAFGRKVLSSHDSGRDEDICHTLRVGDSHLNPRPLEVNSAALETDPSA